ncbi:hypothetical protein K443DRAFT_130999 [Laccaria amethystina LaAM-08-1]|uniref:Actin-like ATPase domain-containing protein n=1 Tax=Laccaria amethystina LaAM-08-1 TaxID=1095629 RepID=A0A0C9XR96_9AGAR|nr:hypothetical protein K443DRAFT_130999 [Laccaria amethystina LaAM-08-1]
MPLHRAYTGPHRKLLLAIDVGTTYKRFLAQEQISGASKIPTIVFYNRQGEVKAVGAEAISEETLVKAGKQGWLKAEWFKLHLRNNTNERPNITEEIPPLPKGKSAVDVLADILRYLFTCSSDYIQDTDVNGGELWLTLKDVIHFVLSHPNGWEGLQQDRLREAAVLAGLIPQDHSGYSRLLFVTKGEASLHFAVQNGLPSGVIERQEGVVIVDAGGGTIDISAYQRHPQKEMYSEICVPQCHFHGSTFVTVNVRKWLCKFLAKSPYLADVEDIVKCFDSTTKHRFKDENVPQIVKFGSNHDQDPKCNIYHGQLEIPGHTVAEWFAPSVLCIVDTILQQKKAGIGISHVVMVGGFACSEWLCERVNVVRAENHINKAVSDGAISFYVDCYVSSCISRYTFGVYLHDLYDPNNPEHIKWIQMKIVYPDHEERIPGLFSVILPRVDELTEFHLTVSQSHQSKAHFENIFSTISCYLGDNVSSTMWKDVESKLYRDICHIEAKLPMCPQQCAKGKGKKRQYFFWVNYDIVLLFGLMELKAQIAWKENIILFSGPANIVYMPDE